MLLVSFLGCLPGVLRWPPAGLWALIMVQYLTANPPETVVAALHPVGAL